MIWLKLESSFFFTPSLNILKFLRIYSIKWINNLCDVICFIIIWLFLSCLFINFSFIKKIISILYIYKIFYPYIRLLLKVCFLKHFYSCLLDDMVCLLHVTHNHRHPEQPEKEVTTVVVAVAEWAASNRGVAWEAARAQWEEGGWSEGTWARSPSLKRQQLRCGLGRPCLPPPSLSLSSGIMRAALPLASRPHFAGVHAAAAASGRERQAALFRYQYTALHRN